MRSIPHLLSLSGLLFATSTLIAQQPTMPTQTLTASAPDTPTALAHSVCAPLAPIDAAPAAENVFLVLQQTHAQTPASTGPFVVYLEPLGTMHRLPAHKVGNFSLYSVAQRSDAQDISLPVPPKLLHRLTAEHAHLQVCVENANPGLRAADAPSATVSRFLLVRPQGI